MIASFVRQFFCFYQIQKVANLNFEAHNNTARLQNWRTLKIGIKIREQTPCTIAKALADRDFLPGMATL